MPEPLTRFYVPSNAVSRREGFGRLLAPETVRSLCDGPPERPWNALTRWSALELPVPIVHPGCLAHPSSVLETLLGLTRHQLHDIALGPAQGASAGDLTPGDPASLRTSLRHLSPEGRGESFLREIEQQGARPDWMILTVVPLPPASMCPPPALRALAALEERFTRHRRLVEIAAPEVILQHERHVLQERFGEVYDELARAFHTRATPLRRALSLSVDAAQFFLFDPLEGWAPSSSMAPPEGALEQGLVVGLRLGADGDRGLEVVDVLTEADREDLEAGPLIFPLTVRRGPLFASDRWVGPHAYDWAMEPCVLLAPGAYRASWYRISDTAMRRRRANWLLHVEQVPSLDGIPPYAVLPHEDEL
ncbi:MAG: hypothetical protein H6734_15885 [Alphaproteobacteria bacterium]|nr:hypothetical protein [Alphaproteobacteria bacterium]